MTVYPYKLGHKWMMEGSEVSDYGIECGYLDYECIRGMLQGCILNNKIINSVDDFECISGKEYDEETDEYHEVFQMYIVSRYGAELLRDFGEIVYYSEELDLYLWGVTHYGTSWNYVLSDVRIDIKE